MTQNGRFLHKGVDGTVYISLEKKGEVVALDPLLPASLRGKSYEEVMTSKSIGEFFELADLVLISMQDWNTHTQNLDMTGVTKAKPLKTRFPAFNLTFLKLRDPKGGLLPQRIAEVLTIVTAYWENPKNMAIKFGYVSQAVHRGMLAADIIKSIRDNTGKNPKTGELELIFPDASPEEALFGALLPLDIPFADVTKTTLEQLIGWISSVPREHETYDDQKRRAGDIVFLGLTDMSGKVERVITDIARDYIWDRIAQPPNYKALWRHIQAYNGLYPAHDPEAEYGEYNARIAKQYDQDANNVTIAHRIIELAKTNTAVPTHSLCAAAWMLWELDRAGKHRVKLEATFNETLQDWFAGDNVMRFMRQIFQNQHYGTGEAELEAYLSDQGQPGILRQLTGFFGQNGKVKTLQEFGVLDEAGQWSEVGFQRQQALAREAHAKDIAPSLEWMRWKLHRRHRADQPVPFKWALMNDHLADVVIHRARRIASIALSGGLLGEKVAVGDSITPEQYQILRKIGAWVNDPLTYDKQDDLWWLGLAAGQQALNWKNWEQVCSFVYDKLDQKPDRALLKDWRDGVITFEGAGRYQQNPATPFEGAPKVGRNDLCPCGSGKKFKKCCGR